MHRKARLLAILLTALASRMMPANAAQQSPFTPVIYAVTVNGYAVSTGTLMYDSPARGLLVAVDDLRAWNFRLPGSRVVIGGRSYVWLRSIRGVTYSTASATLVLSIFARPFAFEPTVLSESRVAQPAQRTRGLRIDYDLTESAAGTAASFSGFERFEIFNGVDSLGSGLLEQHGSNGEQSVRLDTSWTHDDPTRRQFLTIGDAASAANVLLTPVRFGGVSFGTDFSLDPYFRSAPVATVGGSALVPSTVQAYINGALVLQSHVQPGIFSIPQLPVVDDQGDVRVVVTDALGHQQIIEQPYITNAALLQSGLSDYYAAAGALRQDYAVRSDDYGGLVGVGSWRHGISDRFTDEFDAALAPGDQDAGAAGSVLVSRLGVVTAGGMLSAGRRGGGQAVVQFERTSRRFHLEVRDEFASGGFRLLAQPISTGSSAPLPPEGNVISPLPPLALFAPQRSVQGEASWGAWGHGSFSAAYASETDYSGLQTRVLSAGYAVQLKAGWLNLSALQAKSSTSVEVLSAIFVIPLWLGRSAMLQASSGRGSASATVALDQSQPQTGTGIGYHFQTGTVAGAAYHVARLIFDDDEGSLALEGASLGGNRDLRAEIAGSVGILGGTWFAARSLGQSFGLVHVDGAAAGIHVSVDGQDAGTTNSHGNLLLRTLRPFEHNRVDVDVDDLPLDEQIQRSTAIVTPARNAGAVARFQISPLRSVLIRILSPEGTPLPPGTEIRAPGTAGRWFVADQGEAYIGNLAPGRSTLAVRLGQKTCRFTITVAPQTRGILRMAPAICRF